MAKHKNKKLYEIIGWAGVLAILGAYALLSFEQIESNSLVYQLLNLVGALGIIVISTIKGVGQTIILNVVWAIIALLAIIKLATS